MERPKCKTCGSSMNIKQGLVHPYFWCDTQDNQMDDSTFWEIWNSLSKETQDSMLYEENMNYG